jgi:hypothetical protein
MTVTIRIGNAKVHSVAVFPALEAKWEVEDAEEWKGASTYIFSDEFEWMRTNEVGLSNAGWAEFLRLTELEDWSKDRIGTQGTYGLLKRDAAMAEDKLEKFSLLEKDKDPAWRYHYWTLVWFAHWVRWAVDNCETPAIQLK